MKSPPCCCECGDEFHLDDVGGYNPPCPCGCGMCRRCCELDRWLEDSGECPEDDYPDAAAKP